ncbi:MAG TPA: site-specific integrase [Acidimicrobiia bacterium]|nr:site-specific integrase [Acidimicrobiia bacterium]
MRRSGWIEDRHERTGRRWRARYRGPDGRIRSRSFDRKVDADRWLVARLGSIDRGDWIAPEAGNLPLSDAAAAWLAGLDVKPKTRAGYESLLRSRVLPAFGHLPLNRISPAMVREWMAEMSAEGLSASRIKQAKQVLSAPLELAVVDGILARAPTSGVKVPTVRRREQRFLTAEEVNLPAAAAEDAQNGAGLVVETLAWVGMRWGELVALRRSRVHLLRRRIEIAESATELGSGLSWGTPKTHERRLVTMPAFLADRLAHRLGAIAEDGLVFTAPKGGPLRSSPFRQTGWAPAVEASGLGQLRIHDLRGTAASLMISSGANIKAVQRQLGHASAAMTLDLYGHRYEDDLDALSEALDRRFAVATTTPQTRSERGSSDSPAPLSRPHRAPKVSAAAAALDGQTSKTLT